MVNAEADEVDAIVAGTRSRNRGNSNVGSTISAAVDIGNGDDDDGDDDDDLDAAHLDGNNGGVVGSSNADLSNRNPNHNGNADAGAAAGTHTLTHTPSQSSDELLSSSANLLLEPAGNVVNLTRQHDADIFRTTGKYRRHFYLFSLL